MMRAAQAFDLGYILLGPLGLPNSDSLTNTWGEAGGRIVLVFECGGVRTKSPIIEP